MKGSGKRKVQTISKVGLGIGIVCIIAWELGALCYIGMIVNVVSLTLYRSNKHNRKGLWYALIGFFLSALYALVNAYYNGHLG